jgi:hypothetical protein
MDEWTREYLDLIETARITIDKRGQGEFLFGAVKGWLDCRFMERDGLPFVEFSSEGLSEGDKCVWPGMSKPSVRRESRRALVHPPKRRFGFCCEAQKSS